MDGRSRFDLIGLLAPLRRYAVVLTRDDTEAEDLVHDALVRAYERRHAFDPSGNLRGWLFSILHNSFIDAQRRKAAEAARARDVGSALGRWRRRFKRPAFACSRSGEPFCTSPRNSAPLFTSSPLRASPITRQRLRSEFRSAR